MAVPNHGDASPARKDRANRLDAIRLAVESLEARRLFCFADDGVTNAMDISHSVAPDLDGDHAEPANLYDPNSKVITDALAAHNQPGPVRDHKGSWYKAARKITIQTGRTQSPTKTSIPISRAVSTGGKAAAAAAAAAVNVAVNAAGLPLLTSRADGKGLKIFLDFDGYNSDIPFDMSVADGGDGNGATFNAKEQSVIYNAWRDIVSYYSMLDVNVTTIQPPTGGSNPNFVWQRITDSVSGGAAYVGAINNSSSQGWTEDSMAINRTSGIAHEIAHQLSLSHQADWFDDATKQNEYASGYTAHGPIIGVDFAQQVHTWWFGRNSDGADHLQDDLKQMSGYLKNNYAASADGYMPDDYTGTSIAAATSLTLTGGTYQVAGSIERNADSDYFSFSSSGSPFDLHAEPTFTSPLAPKIELYNASGKLIAAKDDTALRNAADNTGEEFTLDLPAGTYYARVSGHGDYSDEGEYAFFATPLPAGWAASDVAPGSTGRGGSANFNAGTFTIVGSGADIGGNADEMHFAYQTLTGDSSITARVTSFAANDPYAKAGIMLRETLAAGSREASLYLTPSRYEYANRTTANGGTNYSYPSLGANSWLRLTRSGNVITYFGSSDGVTFNNLGSVTMSGLATQVFVGMAVTSKSHQLQATGTFTNVATTGTPPAAPTYSSSPAPTNFTATPVAGQSTNVQLAWTAVAAATGYVIERSNDGVNWSLINTLGSGTTSLTSALSFGSMRWWYRVSSINGGTGAPSDPVSVVNKPAAPTNPQAVRMDAGRLSLTWSDVSGDTGYRIERSTDGGATYTAVTTTATNIRGYNVTGLTGGTPYTFRITPTSAVGDGVPLIFNTVTPQPAVTNLRFTNKTSSQMAIAWDDQAGETGFRVDRSTDGNNWTTLTTLAANVTAYTDNTVSPVTEYYYRVAGVNGGVVGVYASVFAATPTAVALPVGWSSGDLGGVGGSGATGQSNGTWTVIGSGRDIWDNSDELQFASRSLTGNGEIVARIASQEDTGGWAKAGVMLRETVTANSRQTMMVLTPGNGSQFGYRTATGGGSDWTGYDAVTLKAPYWVRLVRSGDVVTGYVSPDGTNWTSRGSVTLTGLAATVYVGMANCSSNDGTLNTTQFDNVNVIQAVPPPTLTSVVVEGATTQRSMIHTLTVRFSQPVTLGANAFTLLRNGVPAPFSVSPGTGTSMIYLLSGFGTNGLTDGTYTLTINAAAVTGTGSPMLANASFSFYRLFGDGDGNRAVNFNDYLTLQNAFGSTRGSAAYNPAFDSDDNGVIDFNDFLALQNNFGKTI